MISSSKTVMSAILRWYREMGRFNSTSLLRLYLGPQNVVFQQEFLHQETQEKKTVKMAVALVKNSKVYSLKLAKESQLPMSNSKISNQSLTIHFNIRVLRFRISPCLLSLQRKLKIKRLVRRKITQLPCQSRLNFKSIGPQATNPHLNSSIKSNQIAIRKYRTLRLISIIIKPK